MESTEDGESTHVKVDEEDASATVVHDEQQQQYLPFLLRFPVNSFGVAMGISSQSMVWRAITQVVSKASHNNIFAFKHYIHDNIDDIPAAIGAFFWCIGIITLLITCILYALKLLYYPQEVRMELNHALRSNFFAGPFLACLFLLMGTPIFVRHKFVVHLGEALAFTIPLLVLEVYLYGHWMMGGKRRLGEVANPTTQISVVGNFVGATALGLAGSKDFALFMFSLGIIHQLVVFTTAYARLSSMACIMTPELYPFLFLFVAPPCAASLAWNAMVGKVDDVSKFLLFSGLSMYIILVSRAYTMTRGIRFSLCWWAFTFPSAAAAMAMMAYASGGGGYTTSSVSGWFLMGVELLLVALSDMAVVGVSIATVSTACSGNLLGNELVLSPHPYAKSYS